MTFRLFGVEQPFGNAEASAAIEHFSGGDNKCSTTLDTTKVPESF
jgi:hypothetical protein